MDGLDQCPPGQCEPGGWEEAVGEALEDARQMFGKDITSYRVRVCTKCEHVVQVQSTGGGA